MENRAFKTILIKDTKGEAADVKSFTLSYADNSPIQYQAGQFITFVFSKPDGKDARRNYSFSSTPSIDQIPTITIKRIKNGEYSRWFIDDAKVGDSLLTIGASGNFTLPSTFAAYNQVVFLAAGSGITPIYSLLKEVLHTYPEKRVLLIYSNQSITNTIFYNELTQLEKLNDRLTIAFLFSDSQNLMYSRLNKWLLETLLKKHAFHVEQALYYLCGPFDYMRMATIVLQTEGAPSSNIRREIFSIEKPIQKNEPPDKALHQVTLRMGSSVYNFNVQYPVTILQKAKELNIPIPYSCESGQCGACTATCLTGKVWMWNNEVLVETDLEKGRVLTCTGYAVDGNVTLKI